MNLTVISTQNKQFLALMIGLAALSIYPIYNGFINKSQPKLAIFTPIPSHLADSVKDIMANGSNIADTLQKQLNGEFDQLLANLQKVFPIAPGVWKNTINELEELKRNDTLLTDNPVIKNEKGDLPIVKKIRELLASYNIDPHAVIIQMIHDRKNSCYAFAGQCVNHERAHKVEHYIRLNLAQLSQQTPAVQEALLRHEIVHLLNYDPLTFAMIDELLDEHDITAKEYWRNEEYQALNKHIEFRADLMAASHDVVVAQALMDGFEEHTKRYNDTIESESHPTCKRRQAAVDNLMQYMNVENQIKLA